MRAFSRFGFSALALGMASSAAFMACGGDDSSAAGNNAKPGSEGNGATGLTATLQVLPSPSYSGFDGAHKYQIPLKVNNKTGAKWSVNKPDLVELVETPEGVMLTTKGAGEVIVTATIGSETGASKLSITSYKPEDWSAGDARYNDGISAFGDAGAPSASNPPSANFRLDKRAACTSCHGDTAAVLRVQHTPYQTGGYSDGEMVTLITKGMKPAGIAQRTDIPAFYWGTFHQWDVTEAETTGVVSYLRALTPKSQGMFDYPIRQLPDGGIVDRDGNPITFPDAGGLGRTDAGAAATGGDAGGGDAGSSHNLADGGV